MFDPIVRLNGCCLVIKITKVTTQLFILPYSIEQIEVNMSHIITLNGCCFLFGLGNYWVMGLATRKVHFHSSTKSDN
jgi:hypothetical protein